MPHCDDCGALARTTWRHRRIESEAHRTVRWVCRGCHPDLRPTGREIGDTGQTPADPAETAGSALALRSDGGTRPGVAPGSGTADSAGGRRCPRCLGETIGWTGVYDCVDCDWTGAL